MSSTPLLLVLDWDGTATERDTLHMAITRFGDAEVFRALEGDLDGRRTLDDVIGREMATIRASLEDVVGWLLEHVRVRAGLHELIATQDPLIVSAGFHELIAPILERERLTARVLANHVTADPAGWRCQFAARPVCEACGEPCKRMALTGLGRYVLVGDGVSDRCAALGAERVFARAGLAAWLDGQGVPYERYADLHDVRRALGA